MARPAGEPAGGDQKQAGLLRSLFGVLQPRWAVWLKGAIGTCFTAGARAYA